MTINFGVTVTVSSVITAGTSPATNGVVLDLGSGGHIHIVSGGALNLRGAVRTTGNVFDVAVWLDGGGTWNWDTSASASGVFYQWISINPSNRQFKAAGTDESCAFDGSLWSGATCAIVTATPGNRGSGFGNDNSGSGFSAWFDYAAVSNLGSSSISAIQVSSYNGTARLWLTHTSIADSGRVYSLAATDFKMQGYSGVGCLGDDFYVFDGSTQTRIATDNSYCEGGLGGHIVFGRTWALDRTIGPTLQLGSAGGMGASTHAGNIWLSPGSPSVPFNMSYLYAYWDETNKFNPHGICGNSAITITGYVVESPDPTPKDSGESILQNCSEPGSPVLFSVRNMLQLPNKNFTANFHLGGGYLGHHQAISLQHATLFSFGNVISEGEGGSHFAQMADVQGSIFLSDTSYFKSQDLAPAVPGLNQCTLCDYNVASTAYTATDPACTAKGCTNMANGWAMPCAPASAACPGGQHDLDVLAGHPIPARFIDTNRNLATYDTRGLGNAVCDPWVAGTAYSAGACYSQATPGVYAGAPINYLAKVAHTSDPATKPDVGAAWRTVSEYRSKRDLRIGMVTGADPATALIQWEMAGWTPTNNAYRCERACFPGDPSSFHNMGASPMPPLRRAPVRIRPLPR